MIQLMADGRTGLGYLILGLTDKWAGKITGYEGMITSRVPLAQVVDKGFEELANRKDDHVKILISPKLRMNEELSQA